MRKISIVLGLSVAACSSSGASDVVGQDEQKIINGINSTSDQDAVVQLYYFDRNKTQGIGGCTGTMLSPSIVLTARHCVSDTDGYSACDSAGNVLSGGRIKSDHAANTLYVMRGVKPQFHGKSDGQGTALFVPESKIMCNSDIALIQLAKPIPDAMIAQIRLDAPPVKGETITAVGWGITASGREPSQRQQRNGIPVLDVGPSDNRRSEIGASEFQVGESICSGDSGGPAIAESTGAVIGVVSRGGNGSSSDTPGAACVGLQTLNIYTQVAPHKDLIMQAFAATGEEPWLEGGPDPRKAKAGEACGSGDDCRSAICDNSVCVDPCGEGGTCTDGFTCKPEINACVANLATDTLADEPAKGCSTTGNGGSPVNAAGFFAAGALVLASLRRRKTA